jgi:hypothetical protein
VKLDQVKLMAAVNRHRRKEAMTWNEVNNALGYASDSAIHKRRTGKRMSADTMIHLMTWMGVHDIRIFAKEDGHEC